MPSKRTRSSQLQHFGCPACHPPGVADKFRSLCHVVVTATSQDPSDAIGDRVAKPEDCIVCTSMDSCPDCGRWLSWRGVTC
jgi:hypothetical protein